MLSPLQPSVFLQVFATTILLQEYIEEARDVGSYCNGGFATRILLQKNIEEVLHQGSCCRKIEKKKICNRGLIAVN